MTAFSNDEIAQKYFDTFIDDFGAELNNHKLKKLTSNTDIIGKYAECIVRKMIRRVLTLARISTGTVLTIDDLRQNNLIPQLDTIIWIPNPFPASFDAEEFGIISKPSVLGILEIKSTNYTNAVKNIEETIEKTKTLIPERATNKETKGVICLQTSEEKSLKGFEDNEQIFVLSKLNDKNEIEVNRKGVLLLLNYLSAINTDSISERFYMKVNIAKLK